MTPRQEEILNVLAQGYSIADAACILAMRGDSISKMRWNEEFWARWKAIKASAEYKSAFSARYDFHGPPAPKRPALANPKPRRCRLNEGQYRAVATMLAAGKTRMDVCKELNLLPDQLRKMIPRFESGALPWADVRELWAKVKASGGYAPEKQGWIYFIQNHDGDIRIGYESSKGQRIQSHISAHPANKCPKVLLHCKGTRRIEDRIHALFAAYRIDRRKPSWYHRAPEILAFVKNPQWLLLESIELRTGGITKHKNGTFSVWAYDGNAPQKRKWCQRAMAREEAEKCLKQWIEHGVLPPPKKRPQLSPDEVLYSQMPTQWGELLGRIRQGVAIRVLRLGQHILTLKRPTGHPSTFPSVRSPVFLTGKACIASPTYITAHGRPIALAVPA